jgi:hypothetical protein
MHFSAGIILSVSFASPELIQGLTGKIDRRDGGLKRTCPTRGLTECGAADTSPDDLYQAAGALVPASAAIYEFELRPIVSKSWRPAVLLQSGFF